MKNLFYHIKLQLLLQQKKKKHEKNTELNLTSIALIIKYMVTNTGTIYLMINAIEVKLSLIFFFMFFAAKTAAI